MTDLLIAIGACIPFGFLLGYVVAYYTGAGAHVDGDEARQREIERRLRGRDVARHRAAAEPAVIRAARVARSRAWRA